MSFPPSPHVEFEHLENSHGNKTTFQKTENQLDMNTHVVLCFITKSTFNRISKNPGHVHHKFVVHLWTGKNDVYYIRKPV